MDPCDTFFFIGKQILFSLWRWTTERKETQRELKYFLNYGALCGCRSGHVSHVNFHFGCITVDPESNTNDFV